MKAEEIISLLPYRYPFLFVDELLSVNQDSISGTYRFDEKLPFYEGHFIDNPVTPGVILTETMAQIGVVCLGIYILQESGKNLDEVNIALTSSEMKFFRPVLPNEKVCVKSKKQYFRFNKLKCNVEMYNEQDELVARGNISGMMV